MTTIKPIQSKGCRLACKKIDGQMYWLVMHAVM